jgi:hypothetical protein
MDIQHRLLVIHGSRIIGASDVLPVVGAQDDIDTIRERLDLVVDYGGSSFERVSEGFILSGQRDAEQGMWSPEALSQYARTMVEVDDLLENGRIHQMLDQSIRDSGVPEEHVGEMGDAIVSFHIQGIGIDVFSANEMDLDPDFSTGKLHLPPSYLATVSEARHAHDTLLFVSGLMIEKSATAGIDQTPEVHTIALEDDDTPGFD